MPKRRVATDAATRLAASEKSLGLLEYLYDVSHKALVAGGRATSRVSDDHDAVVVRHSRKDQACQLRVGRIGKKAKVSIELTRPKICAVVPSENPRWA